MFSPQVLTALIAVQVLFGINYVVSKFLVGAFPPLVWGSIRLAASAVALLIVALAVGKKPPRGRQFFVPMIAYSFLGIILNQSAFLVGISYTTATNSAILNTLIPIFTLLFVTMLGQEPLTRRKAFGFFLAFAGVLALRRVEHLSLSDKTLMGDLLTIVNCMSYGLFLSVSKKFVSKNDPLWTTTWLFIYGSVGIGLVSIPSWQGVQWPELTPNLVGAMLFAVLGSTLLAYLLNLWALAHAKSSSVAVFIYLQPVVASGLAWYYFDEHVTARTVLSSLLIFAGVLLALGTQFRVKVPRRL